MIDRAKNVRVTPYDTETEMISSTYGTAELQGDASPSPPKPYMSRVAKIALALIAGAAAVNIPLSRVARVASPTTLA